MEINYIAHDHYTESLLKAIDDIYIISAYNPNKVTFLYLANADRPMVLRCSKETEKEYNDFRYAITNQLKHNVWPEVDIKKLFEILNEDDFIDDEGKPRYSFFTMNFYITPTFISYNYNESLLARLFWDLELSEKKNFQVNIYHPANDGFEYDEEHLFGPKKLNGDYNVYMYTY